MSSDVRARPEYTVTDAGSDGRSRISEAMALKLRAQLHAARGDEEASRKDLDVAIEIFERPESRLELARALVVRGGDEDFARARELFQSCGAT